MPIYLSHKLVRQERRCKVMALSGPPSHDWPVVLAHTRAGHPVAGISDAAAASHRRAHPARRGRYSSDPHTAASAAKPPRDVRHHPMTSKSPKRALYRPRRSGKDGKGHV
jgi:hypothetical protein